MKSLEALRILSECANGEKKLLFSNSLDLEQIVKQDLEVLEIIRKKKVDLQGLSYLLNEYKDAELAYILNQYNPTEYYTRHLRGCLTLEELLKLKQWLEVNE